jgi:hypothetical protein
MKKIFLIILSMLSITCSYGNNGTLTFKLPVTKVAKGKSAKEAKPFSDVLDYYITKGLGLPTHENNLDNLDSLVTIDSYQATYALIKTAGFIMIGSKLGEYILTQVTPEYRPYATPLVYALLTLGIPAGVGLTLERLEKLEAKVAKKFRKKHL